MAKLTAERIQTLISYLPETTIEQRGAKNEFNQKLAAIKPDEVDHYDDYGQPVLSTEVLVRAIIKVLKSDFENNQTIIREHLRQLDVNHQARDLLKSLGDLSFNPMRAKRFQVFAQFLQNENKDFGFLKKVYDENSQDLSEDQRENKLLIPYLLLFGLVFTPLFFLLTLSLVIIFLVVLPLPPLLALISAHVIPLCALIPALAAFAACCAIVNKMVFPSPVAEFESKDTSVILPSGKNKYNRASFWSKQPEYKSMMGFEPQPQELTSNSYEFEPSLSAV